MGIVAYQGIQGSFSHITAQKIFGEDSLYIGLESSHEVFEAIASEKATYAVIPIENSLIGSIHENYDLMHKYDTKIISEHYTGIHYSLMAYPIPEISPEERLNNLKKAYSDPKALEHCAEFFRSYPWIKPIVYMDPAGAASYIASTRNPEEAAIASTISGKIFGLETIQTEIEDDPMNYTRFFAIKKESGPIPGANKCSLCFVLKNTPGALYNALKIFADNHLNLTKIESRPIPKSLFEYFFCVDVELNGFDEKHLEGVLNELKKEASFFKNLGIYPKGNLWT